MSPHRSTIRGLVVAGVGCATLAASAEARTGDTLREGVRNGTASQETEIIGSFDATTGPKGGYVTRQSNVKEGPKAGGAAIYGCRAPAGGTAGGSAPCLRATNLSNGFAFEFAGRGGAAGAFFVDDPATVSTQPPFVTNARGLVSNLNSERLGGLTAAEIIAAARGQQVPGAPSVPGSTGTAGPKGDKGDTGAKGDKGDTGDIGPSNAYAIRNGFLNLANGLATEQTLVTNLQPFELDLPDNGPYIINISGQAIWTTGVNVGNLICRARSLGSLTVLESTGGNLGTASGAVQPRADLGMTFPYVRDASNTGIRLTCQHGGTADGIAQVQDANITAIRVGALDDQTP